jgi:hypothetical protein
MTVEKKVERGHIVLAGLTSVKVASHASSDDEAASNGCQQKEPKRKKVFIDQNK